MANSEIRAAIYCRCSTEEESQKNALIQQVREAKECVNQMGWILTGEFVESKSGTSVSGRSAYLKLLRDLESDIFDVVVIKSIDRLMRNVKDWYLFLENLVQNEKRLYLYLERKFYTPEDNLIVGIKAILAEDYSRELSKKINNAHRHRQQKGEVAVLTSRTFGYIKLSDGEVIVDESERGIIERIFMLASGGFGGDRISNILYDEGVRSRNGKKLGDTSIRRMIRNPIYKGDMVMNRKHYDFELKRTINLPKEEWIIHEGILPPIVGRDLWEEANRQMNLRMRKYSPVKMGKNLESEVPAGKNQGLSVLSGRLVCGFCGAPYYRTTRCSRKKMNHIRKEIHRSSGKPELEYEGSKRDKTKEKIIEWKCHTYIQYGRKSKELRKDALRKRESLERPEGCNNIHLPESYLMELLIASLKDQFDQDPDERDSLIEQVMSILKEVFESDEGSHRREKLEREKEELAYKKNILLDKLLDGVIRDKDYHTKSKQLDERVKVIAKELERFELAKHKQKETQDRLTEIRKNLTETGMDRAAAYDLLQEIQEIRIFPDHLIIVFRTFSAKDADQLPLLSITVPISDQGLRGRSQAIQDQICQCMTSNPHITARQIAEKTDLGISCIQYQIRKLRKAGRIEFIGKGGIGQWKVSEIMESG